MSRYIKIDDLQAYCDNQIDHSITPNDFQRMNSVELVQCKDCRKNMMCEITLDKPNDWFCADGEKKD